MRLLDMLIASLLVATTPFALGASLWTFDDATLAIQSRGAGVGSALKEKLSPISPLSKVVSLSHKDTLKIVLTTHEGKTAKRPHQAFLTITEPSSGLEESFPFSVKESGKGKVEISHKDLPIQLLQASSPLQASIVVASFGSGKPHRSVAFTLTHELDPAAALPAASPPVRYRALEEIHHIFQADPKSPPKLITLIFTAAVVASLPLVLGAWLTLGGNLEHASKAISVAPVSHVLFVGSVIAMEGIFFMYYTRWNLFQTLPIAGAIGLVAYLSGSRALSEVQERRLAGLR